MKKKIFTSILSIVALCATSNLSAQVSNYFSSEADLTNWSGAQCNISYSEGSMQLDVTGGFWAVAAYGPEGGFDWNFDTDKVICIKINKKVGDVLFGFYDGSKDYKMTNFDPINIEGTDSYIFVYNIEDFPELGLEGSKHFNNFQIANEYVNTGNVLNFDFVKSFADLETAYAFINDILEGNDPQGIEGNTEKLAEVTGGEGSVIFSEMETEATVEIFTLSGQNIIKSIVFNNEITGLTAGLYIVKLGDDVTKVLVK